MRSNAKGTALLYHAAPKDKGDDKSRTLPLDLPHDGQPHDFVLKLPFARLRSLRLDPASGPGEIVIERFELRDSADQVVALPTFP